MCFALKLWDARRLNLSCRHWKELMQVTGRQLNLAEDVFKLQHLLDLPLLEHR